MRGIWARFWKFLIRGRGTLHWYRSESTVLNFFAAVSHTICLSCVRLRHLCWRMGRCATHRCCRIARVPKTHLTRKTQQTSSANDNKTRLNKAPLGDATGDYLYCQDFHGACPSYRKSRTPNAYILGARMKSSRTRMKISWAMRSWTKAPSRPGKWIPEIPEGSWVQKKPRNIKCHWGPRHPRIHWGPRVRKCSTAPYKPGMPQNLGGPIECQDPRIPKNQNLGFTGPHQNLNFVIMEFFFIFFEKY